MLFVELWIYALRNPAARTKLAPSFAAKRTAISQLIQREFEDLDLLVPTDASMMAAVVMAMDEGLALHRRIDPEDYPDSLLFDACRR